jgi:adenylate kinase
VAQPDCQRTGWLLDGYPRSASQAEAIEKMCLGQGVVMHVSCSEQLTRARTHGCVHNTRTHTHTHNTRAHTQEGIRPDVFLLVQVPDSILVERVVGRRLDPDTGAIYHLKFKPPPAEVVPRLVQRSDDTEEKVWACAWGGEVGRWHAPRRALAWEELGGSCARTPSRTHGLHKKPPL